MHTLMQFLDLTTKFFLIQARAHTKALRNFFSKRLSFLCLQLVDASFCRVSLVLVIFDDITTLN